MSKWSIPLDKMAARSKSTIDEAGRLATATVFRKVAEHSPVDTGRFRFNWQVTQHTPATGIREGVDPKGTAANNEADKALSMPLGSVVYMTNNLPYARRLEYGWSKQEPAGMVRISVTDFRDALLKGLAK